MNDERTFRALLVDYLDGVPDADAVLSDYLEERGQPRVDNVTRPAARLGVVLGLMPESWRLPMARGAAANLVKELAEWRSSDRMQRFFTATWRWLNVSGNPEHLEPMQGEADSLAQTLDRSSLPQLAINLLFRQDLGALLRQLKALRTRADSWQRELEGQIAFVRARLLEDREDDFQPPQDRFAKVQQDHDGWRADFGEAANYS